jgi:hypothetical protein
MARSPGRHRGNPIEAPNGERGNDIPFKPCWASANGDTQLPEPCRLEPEARPEKEDKRPAALLEGDEIGGPSREASALTGVGKTPAVTCVLLFTGHCGTAATMVR